MLEYKTTLTTKIDISREQDYTHFVDEYKTKLNNFF